jgi:hypothetical protein
MTALAQVPQDIAHLRNSVAEALAFVAHLGTAEEAREAYDRVKLAKEWAKIRKVAKEMHTELLRLEIHLLRKVAQLDALSAVPAAHRAAAKFFASKSDEQIDKLIRDYGDGGSPTRLMKRVLGDDEQARARHHYTSGEYVKQQRYVGDEARAEAVQEQARNVKEGLAALLENYYEGDEGFSVFELAEQVCESVGIDQRSAVWGRSEGLLEVCRKAVRDAPSLAVLGTEAPRFVTCIDRGSAYDLDLEKSGKPHWVRVPFHVASLEQLDDMVALRQEQASKAAAVAESLANLRNELAARLANGERSRSILGHAPDVTLGELAARIAFTPRLADTA